MEFLHFNPASRVALVFLLALLTVFLNSCRQDLFSKNPVPTPVASEQTYSWVNDVKPILDQKCIACHACNDAPCQLKLTSVEGLLRGATRNPVYDSKRIFDAQPTRLFVDAHGESEWRELGFHSVFNNRSSLLQDNLSVSTLYQMIALGRDKPLQPETRVAPDIELGLGRVNQCPTPDSFVDYATKNPQQGMPLALSPLSDGEFHTLEQWILEGGVIDEKTWQPTPAEQQQILQWEGFFNQPSLRHRLVSRYLYEHLFPAHLYFEELDSGNFFELVRSSTPPGIPIKVIATLRPNDDPGSTLYYRLRRVESTLVHKTHMPYPLGQIRMQRFQEWFLADDWTIELLPDYSRENAINPFVTFKDIPAGGRYRFMLDTAEYFVKTFIRGPVCAGQIATNVIRDQFYVMFQAPEADLAVTDPDYMRKIIHHLQLVPQQEGLLRTYLDWKNRLGQMNEYNRLRGEYYRKLQPRGRSLDDLWSGDGSNPSAALTVFRNFDNAMVTRGFIGANPKTLWVMDYPMLERSYYLLVVNFNVFGSLATQAETRLYFDLIRANAENNFLHFMPPQARAPMRDSWYQGSKAQTKISTSYTVVNEDLPVQIDYQGPDPKAEFIDMTAARLGTFSDFPDTLNRCARPPCHSAGAGPALRRIQAALQSLTSTPAMAEGMSFIDFMPDNAFLRITSKNSDQQFAFALIRNKAHTNVAFMFNEEKRRLPGEDTLTIYPGLIGSYPNFMFTVPLEQVEAFASELHAVGNRASFEAFIARYGLMRSDPAIWANFEWFIDYMRTTRPLEAGVYDLSRYKKIANLTSDEID
jgi:hypothetical protein